MDTDADLEIVININTTIYALNKDGSNVAGWPINVGTQPIQGAPAFGDVDGDGQEEIVCVSFTACFLHSKAGREFLYSISELKKNNKYCFRFSFSFLVFRGSAGKMRRA